MNKLDGGGMGGENTLIGITGAGGAKVEYKAYFDTVDDAKAAYDIDIDNNKLSKTINIKNNLYGLRWMN